MSEAAPLILRRWSSRIRTEDQEAYFSYIRSTGVEDYLNTPGNLGCEMLLRDCGDGSTEVSTLSWWQSMESIRAFAGDDVERARYYPEDDRSFSRSPITSSITASWSKAWGFGASWNDHDRSREDARQWRRSH